jgi:hypothetical protein
MFMHKSEGDDDEDRSMIEATLEGETSTCWSRDLQEDVATGMFSSSFGVCLCVVGFFSQWMTIGGAIGL